MLLQNTHSRLVLFFVLCAFLLLCISLLLLLFPPAALGNPLPRGRSSICSCRLFFLQLQHLAIYINCKYILRLQELTAAVLCIFFFFFFFFYAQKRSHCWVSFPSAAPNKNKYRGSLTEKNFVFFFFFFLWGSF